MSTPSLQTFVTDASQVLNLSSISAVRSVVAVALANANAGTPLNPNLTTQQLWNEFYQVVTEPKSNIESFIANQMMKFFFSPPAPGGAGADKQVIFNDMGVLAGDAGLVYNKTTDALTVAGLVTAGSATITGAATVGTTLGVTGVSTFAAGTALLPALTTTGDTNTGIYYPAADTFAVTTGGTERYRVDSSGNVGIGVTPSAWGSNYTSVELTKGACIYGAKNVPYTIVGANVYNDATNEKYTISPSTAATKYQQYGGVHSWHNAVAGTINTAIAFTQALTLDASGNLFVAKTSSSSASTGCELQTGTGGNAASVFTADAAIASIMNRLTSDGTIIDFRRETLSVGNIAVTTLATTYNSISDYRLKEAVQPLVGGLARVSALKPSIYKWKVNGSDGEGFLAHELASVVSAAVTGEKDAVNEDGSINAQSIDMSRIVPILVAAIQELTARVQTLEAR